MGTDENAHLKETAGTQCSVAEKVLNAGSQSSCFGVLVTATLRGNVMFEDQANGPNTKLGQIVPLARGVTARIMSGYFEAKHFNTQE